MDGHVEHGLRDQRAVGDHRAAVGGDLAQPVEEQRVAGPARGEYLETDLGGPPRHRARFDVTATPGRRVGTGQHRDDLVP